MVSSLEKMEENRGISVKIAEVFLLNDKFLTIADKLKANDKRKKIEKICDKYPLCIGCPYYNKIEKICDKYSLCIGCPYYNKFRGCIVEEEID